ncbi:MAG: hypothetical protein QG628_244 [Patescibacteria group bacterium]|nr:hypothetical protein [Patescibacteria group bacterium]
MAELKTKKNDSSVIDFINSVEDEGKRKDSVALLEIFKECTGETATMWGSSIIGYGNYHYKSERSSQEGDWPLTGFSPRKQNLTLYIPLGFDKFEAELKALGKCKTSVGCLYIKRLSDIDLDVLKFIIKDSVKRMRKANTK